MSWAFIGHGRFGAAGLEALVTRIEGAHGQVVSVAQDFGAFSPAPFDDALAVARVAERHGLAVTYLDARSQAYADHLQAVRADVGLIMRYPRKLPSLVTAVPRLGFFNVHPSDLPRHRGAAPLEHAIVHDDQLVMTIHHVTERFDEGPILYQSPAIPITGMYIEELFDAVVTLGAESIREAAPTVARGTAALRPQDATRFTLALKRSLPHLLGLDFTRDPADRLHRKLLARGRAGTRVALVDMRGEHRVAPVQVLGVRERRTHLPPGAITRRTNAWVIQAIDGQLVVDLGPDLDANVPRLRLHSPHVPYEPDGQGAGRWTPRPSSEAEALPVGVAP